jgi:hypothetical protein
MNFSITLAKNAINTLESFNGNIEDAVIAQVTKAAEQYHLTPAQKNGLFYQVMDDAENMPLESRAQYLKNSSEDCEKWFDPKTGKCVYVFIVNGVRDWANAK